MIHQNFDIDVFICVLVPPCQSNLTSEHSVQISANLIYETQKEDCLDLLVNPFSSFESAVYCPTEDLCGLGLMPNKTRELNFLHDKNCWTFAKQLDFCAIFDQQLSASGKCFGRSFTEVA